MSFFVTQIASCTSYLYNSNHEGFFVNIGLYTDTYSPQIGGVATPIQTLKGALEKQGHNVFISTTTDPHVGRGVVELNVFRFSSVPFISFTDRRITFRGLFETTRVAKEVQLDIVHTQAEFSMSLIGEYVTHQLDIPTIHAYHIMYEGYLHHVLNGNLLRSMHVKRFTKAYLKNMDGVIAPNRRVENLLERYGVRVPIEVISAGVDIEAMNGDQQRDVCPELEIDSNDLAILALSRITAEKKIDRIPDLMPELIGQFPNLKLVTAGDGPDVDLLKNRVERLSAEDYVIFTDDVPHEDVDNFYRMADLFVSVSNTEAQGLTYIGTLAVETKSMVFDTDYTENVFNSIEFGQVFNNQKEIKEAIISYLKQGEQPINPSKLKTKLENISVAHFGKEAIGFYQATIDTYSNKEVNDD